MTSVGSAPAVFVAGGAGGVGSGVVGRWLDAGATVATVSRSEAALEALRAACGDSPRLITEPGSSSDVALLARLADRYGPFDQVVASIGGGGWELAPLQEIGTDMFGRVIADGIEAHWHCARALRPSIRTGGSHVFVNGGAAEHIVAGTGPLSLVARAQLTLAEIFDAEDAPGRVRTASLVLRSPIATASRGTEVEPAWLTPADVGDACIRIHALADVPLLVPVTGRRDIAELVAE